MGGCTLVSLRLTCIKTIFVQVDFLDNASARKAATETKNSVVKIDILVSNVGIAAKKEFVSSKNSVEQHLAANLLDHSILTNLLADTLIQS